MVVASRAAQQLPQTAAKHPRRGRGHLAAYGRRQRAAGRRSGRWGSLPAAAVEMFKQMEKEAKILRHKLIRQGEAGVPARRPLVTTLARTRTSEPPALIRHSEAVSIICLALGAPSLEARRGRGIQRSLSFLSRLTRCNSTCMVCTGGWSHRGYCHPVLPFRSLQTTFYTMVRY